MYSSHFIWFSQFWQPSPSHADSNTDVKQSDKIIVAKTKNITLMRKEQYLILSRIDYI